jgi:spermidine synthase
MDTESNSIIFTSKTIYHDISVVDKDNIRYLVCGNGIAQEQSAIDLRDLSVHVFDYSLLFMHSLLFIPKPSNILIIGLGGGVVPRRFSNYLDANIDIIEIDPDIVEIAEKFFFFKKTDKINIHIGDAFNIIPKMANQYDIIILDAFLSNYIPYHLMCEEFFTLIKQKTKYNSIVCSNVANGHVSFNNYVKTMSSVFGDNIYRLDGIKNNRNTMLFFLNGDVKMIDDDIYMNPEKFEISEDIKKSKIFNLRS